MYILMIILKKEEYLHEILTVLLDLEVVDVVSIDAESLKNLLGKHLPIFAELRMEVREEKKRKIIIAPVESGDIPAKLCKRLKESFDIDLEEEGAGRILLIPVNVSIGKCE